MLGALYEEGRGCDPSALQLHEAVVRDEGLDEHVDFVTSSCDSDRTRYHVSDYLCELTDIHANDVLVESIVRSGRRGVREANLSLTCLKQQQGVRLTTMALSTSQGSWNEHIKYEKYEKFT